MCGVSTLITSNYERAGTHQFSYTHTHATTSYQRMILFVILCCHFKTWNIKTWNKGQSVLSDASIHRAQQAATHCNTHIANTMQRAHCKTFQHMLLRFERHINPATHTFCHRHSPSHHPHHHASTSESSCSCFNSKSAIAVMKNSVTPPPLPYISIFSATHQSSYTHPVPLPLAHPLSRPPPLSAFSPHHHHA